METQTEPETDKTDGAANEVVSMFKYFSNMLPMTFDNYFQLNNEIHSYYTRSSTKIHKPYFRTNYMKYSIKNKGNTIWNNLPETIKESKSYHIFKSKIKKYLLLPNNLN